MNLVPPYDVMCLHRRISTSWLCSSLFCFSPPTRIPRGLRAGGLVVGRSCPLVVVPAPSVSKQQQQQLHQVWFCGCGREGTLQRNPGGQQPGLTGRRPLGRGS